MSKIEWTDVTWNPVVGCSKVSEGCRSCYAIRDANRLAGNPNPKIGPVYQGLTKDGNWTGIVRLVEERLEEPLRWRKPRRVFVNSMSDLFHESLSESAIRAVFMTMARARKHTFQVLTKRPARMLEVLREWQRIGLTLREGVTMRPGSSACLPNVWLGVSVEDQRTADERIPLLLQTPAAIRFISAEPLLGAVDLEEWVRRVDHCGSCGAENQPQEADLCPECGADNHLISTWGEAQAARYRDGTRYEEGGPEDCDEGPPLHWVIVGGESGPKARPMHPDWARSLRDQCQNAGVAFHFKQHGEWLEHRHGQPTQLIIFENGETPTELDGVGPHCFLNHKGERFDSIQELPQGQRARLLLRVGKKAAGRELDGRTWDELPEVRP